MKTEIENSKNLEYSMKEMNTYKICLILGLIIQFAFLFAYKKITDKKVYWSLLSISTFLALTGFFVRNLPEFKHFEINASVFFYLPLFSLLYLGLFRLFFQEIFGEEPIMAQAYSLSWDQGEYRRLHFGDILFTSFTILSPFFTVMLINKLFYA